jgi:hypothetical protein
MNLIYTENSVVNLDRLLVAAKDVADKTVLLFDNGSQLSVSEDVKNGLIEALKQLRVVSAGKTNGRDTASPSQVGSS